jgi:putative flavoprotein involved in K+ transport
MQRIDAVIIGAGQAGLAMSHCLARLGVDHVVLERGRIGERWRSATWDSLRLLTPNWMTRLPGWAYAGPDLDGFMSKDELVSYLSAYARSYRAPVHSETAVHSVRACGNGYHVATSRGDWLASVVVIATGECQSAAVPAIARRLSPDVQQVTLPEYRNPDALPPGGVLVVGASASGAQLADEILQSGRPVTLAVGRHTRLPRRYRGRDIMAWMDVAGIWDERAETVPDLERARCQPSLQLIGSRDGRTVDLPTLQQSGVRLVGRLTEIEDRALYFADDLAQTSGNADQKLARLLERIDDFIEANGLAGQANAPERIAPANVDVSALRLDTAAAGIRTVVWATGYRRGYAWLDLPALDDRGELAHEGGVTPLPGLYALGLRFMRRRKSNFIDGVGRDAEELADHIAGYLKLGRRLAA